MVGRSVVLVGIALLLRATPAAAAGYVGAGCIIKVGESIVMVRDVWSGRWSLPGGGAEPGETSAVTATRETGEETGLAVRAHAHLGAAANGFRIYACTPLAGVVRTDAAGRLRLPPSGWRELAEVRLLDAAALPHGAWRFPRQRAQVLAMVGATATLTDVAQAPLAAPDGALGRELGATRWLRALPYAQPVRRLAGALGGPTALCATIAWVWCRRGRRRGAALAHLVLGTGLAGCVLRAVAAVPRPWHLDPGLASEAATGYGFAGSQALWVATAAGAAALHSRRPAAWPLAAGATAVALLTRVAAGTHFAHDGLAAVLLAGAALAIAPWLRRRLPRGVRLGGAVVAGLAALVGGLHGTAQPDAVAYGAALLGLCSGRRCWPQPAAAPVPPQALALGLAGGLLVGSVAVASRPVEGAHLSCVLQHAALYAALGALLPAVEALLGRRPAAAGQPAGRREVEAPAAEACAGLAPEPGP